MPVFKVGDGLDWGANGRMTRLSQGHSLVCRPVKTEDGLLW